MSAAVLPQSPSNPSALAAAADAPNPVARLLTLVRKLIDYGKQLAATFQQGPSADDLTATWVGFGTEDIALILARITQGLHRANALEARLAAAERLETPAPERPATSAPTRHPPRERAASSSTPSQHSTGAEPTDPRLAPMPTPEQIADRVRHQPIGAVIADICRDLGIVPGHALWHEITGAIMLNGGNLVALYSEIGDRLYPFSYPVRTPTHREPRPPDPPDLAKPSTGPP